MADEAPLPLLDFQIHFARTHIKDRFDELMAEAQRSGKPIAEWFNDWLTCKFPNQNAYRDDSWFAREVALDECYFAHTDFRGHSIPKDERFVDFLPTVRAEIDSGEFPCSEQIRLERSGVMPEPMAQERGSGRYYILDGQCRVISHWYHNVSPFRVFIYRGKANV